MMRRLDLTDNERAVLITTLRRLVDFHQVVSFKSPADTPAMPGMLRKSTAFVPRYQKFESISLQRRVCLSRDFVFVGKNLGFPRGFPACARGAVGREPQRTPISRQPAAISLRGHIPVPYFRRCGRDKLLG